MGHEALSRSTMIKHVQKPYQIPRLRESQARQKTTINQNHRAWALQFWNNTCTSSAMEEPYEVLTFNLCQLLIFSIDCTRVDIIARNSRDLTNRELSKAKCRYINIWMKFIKQMTILYMNLSDICTCIIFDTQVHDPNCTRSKVVAHVVRAFASHADVRVPIAKYLSR